METSSWLNRIFYVFDGGNRSSFDGRVGRIDTTSADPIIEPVALTEVPRFPAGFDVDASGNVFVFYGGAVLKFAPDGPGSTVAGGGAARLMGNGEPAGSVAMGQSARISLDRHGKIWVADSSNRRVHVLEPVP